MTANAAERAAKAFLTTYQEPAPVLARAPGRVNVIGEHTDYNDGYVLPIALPFDTVIAARPVPGEAVDVSSEGFGTSRFNIGDDPTTTDGWARYLHGVTTVIADWLTPQAWQGTIATDIPAGASLSSSAAIEVAASLLYSHLAGVELSTIDVAKVGQRVENDVLGLPSGLLDQLASAGGQAGHATLIDCRDLSMRAVPFPRHATIVVLDTGTRRELVESQYADRQATCARAAEKLGLSSLRDATLADLDRLPDEIECKRVRHVVTENERTLAAVDAMTDGDLEQLGELMTASHESLRHDYHVSGPALDAAVETALGSPGCYGARMTGGGFAGGAIALVATDSLQHFGSHFLDHYQTPEAQPAQAPLRIYPVEPSAGASVKATS